MNKNLMLLLSFAILGVITFGYRYFFISPLGRKYAEKVSPEFLRLLGPATFSAIIFNNILGSLPDPQEFQQKVLVAALSVVVAYFSKSVIATLVFGLGALYILQNYIGWP